MTVSDAITPTSASCQDGLFKALFRIVVSDVLGIVYRLRATGLGNIPSEGGALVIHNHVSLVDWLLVAISCPRFPRFVMHVGNYDRPVLRWIFDAFGVIPIASRKMDPQLLARASVAIDEALADGELVVVCPERGMTPDGEMLSFRRGAAAIVHRCSVPVVPMALSGLWGSVFSREGGRPLCKLPRRQWRGEVRIVVGRPIPARHVTTERLFERVALLRGRRR